MVADKPTQPCPHCEEIRKHRFCSHACYTASRTSDLVERFWSKVTKSDDCWRWTGTYSDNGYGFFQVRKNDRRSAHRMAFELTYGPIPKGLLVCHRCDNRAYVRPDHLFLGTYSDNMQDAVRKGRHVSGIRHWARKNPERMQRGEAHAMSKLTAAAVREIRTAHAAGVATKELRQRYGVCNTSILNVLLGKTWGHVK